MKFLYMLTISKLNIITCNTYTPKKFVWSLLLFLTYTICMVIREARVTLIEPILRHLTILFYIFFEKRKRKKISSSFILFYFFG